jgi:minor histocompatibility antigen H13
MSIHSDFPWTKEQTMSASTGSATATPDAPSSASSDEHRKKNHYNYLLFASYGGIVLLWGVTQAVYVDYVIHLLCLVTLILYVACHESLVLREEPIFEERDGHSDGESENKKELFSSRSFSDSRETLRQEDAYQFPIIGSVSLCSLYAAFYFLDKDTVNLLIGAYFGIIGTFAIAMTITPFVIAAVPRPLRKGYGGIIAIPHVFPEWIAGPSPWEFEVYVSGADILSFLFGVGVVYLYFQSKPWYLNNVLGICFCLQGIGRFSLGTYKIAAILLVGLFFYDIFWVFGTDVMVTVATKLEGPIKILFPRGSLDPVNPETGAPELSLLGLGDIVLPGFFLALLLRFDAHQANIPTRGLTPDEHVHAVFPKPYFHTAMVGYVLGLATTLFVMIQFRAAQPALLYLVPAVLGASFGCAFVRGEIKELLAYSEELPEIEEEGPAAEEKVDGDNAPSLDAAQVKKEN